MAEIPNNLLPQRDVYDVDVIQSFDVDSQDFKDFLVRLYQITNDIKISMNARDGGYFPLGEFNSGMQYYPNTIALDPTATPRTIFRDTVNFGALPNAGSKSVNHGINPDLPGVTADYRFLWWYAMANDPVNFSYYPIPQADVAGNITDLYVTQTQITISTNWNASAYSTDVTLFYIVN